MKIEKIKQVNFEAPRGPSTTTSIGFEAGPRSFILGTYCDGYPFHRAELAAVEAIVDHLVSLSKAEAHGKKDGEKLCRDRAHEEVCRLGEKWLHHK